MDGLGAGSEITGMRNRIAGLKRKLEDIGPEPESMPEMIESANMMRKNMHLETVNRTGTELLEAYEEYTERLESLLRSVLEIEKTLFEVLRDQNLLIENAKKGSSSKKPKTTGKSRTGRARRPM